MNTNDPKRIVISFDANFKRNIEKMLAEREAAKRIRASKRQPVETVETQNV
jgi:hypothetical protein